MLRRLMVFVAASGLAMAAARGQDGAAEGAADENGAPTAILLDRTPLSCISMSRIQRTAVIDDRTILFVGRGPGRAYVNVLEQNCPTLKANGLFRYRINSGIRTARLCDSQAITVIDRLTDSLTNNCRLGSFHPITAEEVERLLDPDGASSVVLEPIEAGAEDDEAAAGGDDGQ